MVGLLNGSPKVSGSASGTILEQIRGELGPDTVLLSARENTDQTYAQLAGCDAAVIAFPIYADALPSHLLRFLMDWEDRRKQHGRPTLRIYAVSQAGFYDSKQCRWSLDIIRNFCAHAGLAWCGGAGLGGAGLLAGSGVPQAALLPLRNTISALAKAVKSGDTWGENRFTSVGMPRWLYLFMGNRGWKVGAKQNGLKAKALKGRE